MGARVIELLLNNPGGSSFSIFHLFWDMYSSFLNLHLSIFAFFYILLIFNLNLMFPRPVFLLCLWCWPLCWGSHNPRSCRESWVQSWSGECFLRWIKTFNDNNITGGGYRRSYHVASRSWSAKRYTLPSYYLWGCSWVDWGHFWYFCPNKLHITSASNLTKIDWEKNTSFYI